MMPTAHFFAWLAKQRDGSEFSTGLMHQSSVDGVLVVRKAIIQTPIDPKTGKVDLSRVPSGASVWITVTDPESPLYRRHILLHKRPDGLFAIAGGAGFGSDEEVEARRHLVLIGTPKKTRRDIELEEEIEQVKRYNEPLIYARREIEREARKVIQDASEEMLSALGIKHLGKNEFLKHKDEIQRYVESVLGEEHKAEAKRITDQITRHIVLSEKEIKERVQRERSLAVVKIGKKLQKLQETGEAVSEESLLRELRELAPDYESQMINLPDVGKLQGLTPEQQELEISRYFAEQAENFFDDSRVQHEPGENAPQAQFGQTLDPLQIASYDQLKSAVDKVKNYWAKRKQVEELRAQIKKAPLSQITPSTLADFKLAIAEAPFPFFMEDAEGRIVDELNRWARNNSALALYDAIGDFWNDDVSLIDTITSKEKYDSTMKFHIDAGAATALAALAKQYLGTRLDVARLIQNANLETAAASVAYAIRVKDITAEKYNRIIDDVRKFNAANQIETERRGLARHADLKRQWDSIQRQKENMELLDRVKISSLEADNLIEQRKNLGNMLGSLQASATFYDQLVRLRSAKDDVIGINVGGNADDAEALVRRLGLRHGYVIDNSDPDHIRVRASLAQLQKHVVAEKDNRAKHDEYEHLKTDMSGVSIDDDGNMFVESFDVPFWHDRFIDVTGRERTYKWRVEQRNDINWLLKVTEKSDDNPNGNGGGVITRTVGAGKTNTALGFYAIKIKENPEYRGLVVVPKGRAQQWGEEAKRFTSLNVQVVPDGTARETVNALLASIKPGTIVVLGHREAARSHDILEAIQTSPDSKFRIDGMVIDEPQELQARGQRGNIGALGKRLMRIPMRHRIALTATPARRNPSEAYDLIRWAQGTSREIGSRASFVRTFSGFGSGTNAQDTAINKLYFDTIKPYVSGDRLTTPNFKVERQNIGINRSPAQIEQQRRIELESADYISRRRREIIDEVQTNVNHPIRRLENWEFQLPRKATEMARKEVEDQHIENMDDGDWRQNAKLVALGEALSRERNKKHVIFVDSKVQRQSMMDMLRNLGYSSAQIKNIAATTGAITGEEMAARAKEFRENPNVNIIAIDKSSSTGYNLQQGDVLHIIGTPQDASVYLQAQGRIARMPRKGDVKVLTYKYDDDPVHQAKWNNLEAQLKVLRAASPAMFVGYQS